MIIELSFLLLAFSKIQPALSTLVQAYFVLVVPLLWWLRQRGALVREFVFLTFLVALLLLSTLLNQGNFVYVLKNGAYLILLPLLRSAFQPYWFHRKVFFLLLLSLLVLLWHLIDPTSYITRDLGGSPRMVGFGVNPNVWGLISVLLLACWRIWPIKNIVLRSVMIILLVSSVFESGSSTALLCLPLCAAMSFRQSCFYMTMMASLITVFIWMLDDDLMAFVPSLFARFDLWEAAINEIKPHTFLYGNGYDFFGAGFGTVNATDIRIVDSFYISSFVSGGVFVFTLITWFFIISPLIFAIRQKDQTQLNVVLIFIIANAMGNFLENGFPANILYWLIVLSLQQARNRQVRMS